MIRGMQAWTEKESGMSYDKFPGTAAHSFHVLIVNVKALQMLPLVSKVLRVVKFLPLQ
jgi:hypothetical protein